MIREKIQNQGILRFLYGSAFGRWIAGIFLSRKLFSRIHAAFYNRKRSRGKIESFIRKYDIPMGDFEEQLYTSFNAFFIRRFRGSVRSFVKEPLMMPAFVEGRYRAWGTTSLGTAFSVKGLSLTVEALLASKEKAGEFLYGPVIVARLAPQDYHRVHFVDSGRIVDYYRIEGALHSVNPIALSSIGNIFCMNAREVTVQETDNFGRIAYVEVGAMTVGKIVQHGGPGGSPRRGSEKSHFEYGASTVVLLGEQGLWIPEQEILDRTREGIETFVELGTVVAHKPDQTHADDRSAR